MSWWQGLVQTGVQAFTGAAGEAAGETAAPAPAGPNTAGGGDRGPVQLGGGNRGRAQTSPIVFNSGTYSASGSSKGIGAGTGQVLAIAGAVAFVALVMLKKRRR